MRCSTKHHRFYRDIDPHARTMYVCIMDHEGTILTHRNLPAATEALADVLGPYREDLVLAVVSTYGKAKALSIIAQKLGRTVYVMLKRRTPFDAKLFFETLR